MGGELSDPLTRRRRLTDRIAEKVIFGFALLAIAIIFLIFVYVAREAAPLLWRTIDGVSASSPFQSPVSWQPVSGVPKYNVLPLILGTFKVTLIAMLFATPLALAAALYTAEFAPPSLKEWIKPAVELLAGIPSVVVGFFALIVLASWVRMRLALSSASMRLRQELRFHSPSFRSSTPSPKMRSLQCRSFIAKPRWPSAHRNRRQLFGSFCLPQARAYSRR
jgi:ABC-type phosphate transport system permease subunit